MRIRSMLAAILVGACIFAACTPEEPISSPTSEEITETTPVYPPVADFQQGIQVYWHPEGDPASVAAAAERVVDYVASLGANAIGISFPVYADSVDATSVRAGNDTPSPDQLGVILRLARQRGLVPHVRVLVDDASLASRAHPDGWRGTLVPRRPGDWFASYGSLLASYAPTLTRYNVSEYTVGAELIKLQATEYHAHWQAVQHTIRSAGYEGRLSYDFNWDSIEQLPFEAYGLDAYPKLELSDAASVEELTDALSAWVNTLPHWLRQEVGFQEVGIAALSGSYQHPWQWGDQPRSGEALQLTLQHNWFAAMCQVARQSGAQGIYYWMVDGNDTTMVSPAAAQQAPPKSFIGRPAEQAIKQCFGA